MVAVVAVITNDDPIGITREARKGGKRATRARSVLIDEESIISREEDSGIYIFLFFFSIFFIYFFILNDAKIHNVILKERERERKVDIGGK